MMGFRRVLSDTQALVTATRALVAREGRSGTLSPVEARLLLSLLRTIQYQLRSLMWQVFFLVATLSGLSVSASLLARVLRAHWGG